MNAYAKQRACTRVLGVLELMVESDVSPSNGCYITALATCRRAQRWSDAFAVYSAAMERNATLDLGMAQLVAMNSEASGKREHHTCLNHLPRLTD